MDIMKKSQYLIAAILLLMFSACGGEDQTDLTPELPRDTPQEAFFANLFSLCGETFVGESTFPDDPDHDLVDTELRATVETCTEEQIKVDFLRDGGTWHATWVLEMREGGLHLYHDHIGEKEYEEGEEPLTGYGGYADERGSEYQQYFPADDYTSEILPEAATNVWMMEYDPENETFVYALERHQEPRFRAVLTKQ
jgi:hypothetical protein